MFMDLLVGVITNLRHLFLSIIFLFSCNEEKKIDVFSKEIIPTINEYTSEINDISNSDLLNYYCNQKVNNKTELTLLKLSYINMKGETKIGELVVDKNLSEEVVDIFEEIYNCKFPIEKMITIDYYNCNDDKSMEDNNTSAFNYRMVSGSRKLSDHSYGRAIDINPLLNPYIRKRDIQPKNGEKYVDRTQNEKGMIHQEDCVVKAFKSRGWQWGGDWKYSKDYQHFYKY